MVGSCLRTICPFCVLWLATYFYSSSSWLNLNKAVGRVRNR